MAEVSLPPMAPASMEKRDPGASSSTELYHTLEAEPGTLMGPDPAFVFPPREDPTTSAAADAAAAMTATENVPECTTKPTTGRSRPDHISINKLPPFMFPAPVTPPAQQSGQSSPTRSIPISRAGGHHRRGGSEFIGGDGSTLGPGLMSASPTKTSDALPSPSVTGRRRGHAHRRSDAVSSHDLSAILKPADPNKLMSGSAPTTPSHSNGAFSEHPSLDRAASQPTLARQVDSPTRNVEGPNEAQPPPAVPRPRVVGFSDKLEFIPRPLSTISSATSSSMSTIRPSHSLTGSVTSIPSVGASSPPSTRKPDHFRSPSLGAFDPINSSPFDALAGPSRSSQRPNTPLRTRSTSSDGARESSPDQRSSTSDHETGSQSTGPATLAPSVFSQISDIPPARQNFPRIGSPQDLRRTELQRPRSSPEAKVSKSSKKGKSWTGLLSRRPRQQGTAEIPAPLRPVGAPRRAYAPVNDLKYEDIDFDVDNTYVIRNPDYVAPLSAPADKTRMFQRNEDSDDDEPTGVLDINEEWAAQNAAAQNAEAQRAAAGKRRQLHSAGAPGSFPVSAMHHHRRAESAPVLAPFDNLFSGHRLGGSPQMADVFEEDEHEESSMFSRDSRASLGAKADQKAPTVSVESEMTPGGSAHGGSPEPINEWKHRPMSESKQTSSANTEGDDTPREASPTLVNKSSDEVTVTTTPSASNVSANATATIPGEVGTSPATSRRTVSIPEYPGMAADPSPDPAQSSFDVPRLHTAHSSITDRSAWSSARTGDSASGLQYSTDDVAPSLTSISSTRTGPGGPPPLSPLAAAPAAPAGHGVLKSESEAVRSQSVTEGGFPSATASRRTGPRPLSSASKRASLASLSRLVGGSFGERSKLSIESRAEDVGSEAGSGEKKKKNRISRLVRFFKSKENLKGPSEGG